jgi:hypothetical protein
MNLLPYRLYPRIDWSTGMVVSVYESRKGVIGDMAAEWMTQEDWDKHARYVEELGDELGKPVFYRVFSRWCEPFDGPLDGRFDRAGYPIPQPEAEPRLSSYKMMFFDCRTEETYQASLDIAIPGKDRSQAFTVRINKDRLKGLFNPENNG